MKKILKYTKGKQNTYIVKFEDEELILYDDLIIKYELLLKKKITEDELKIIKEENKALESYYKALSYVSKKMRTSKELKEYLKKNNYDGREIEKTIQKLLQEQILNDDYYTQIFINDSIRLNLDGPEKIIKKLVGLGIKEEVSKNYIDKIEKEIWTNKIQKIIKKRQNANHKESINIWKQKLISYLKTQGYSYSLIQEEIDKLELKNDPNIILKEKEKLEKKLSRKFSEEQLTFQLKQKLYQKGFSKEEIENII